MRSKGTSPEDFLLSSSFFLLSTSREKKVQSPLTEKGSTQIDETKCRIRQAAAARKSNRSFRQEREDPSKHKLFQKVTEGKDWRTGVCILGRQERRGRELEPAVVNGREKGGWGVSFLPSALFPRALDQTFIVKRMNETRQEENTGTDDTTGKERALCAVQGSLFFSMSFLSKEKKREEVKLGERRKGGREYG